MFFAIGGRSRPVPTATTRRADRVQRQRGVLEMEPAAGRLSQRYHRQLPGRHTRRCQLGRAEQCDGQREHADPIADEPHDGRTVQGHDSGRDENRIRPVHGTDRAAHGPHESNKVYYILYKSRLG